MGGFDYRLARELPVGAQIAANDLPNDGKWMACNGSSVASSICTEYASIRSIKGFAEGPMVQLANNLLGFTLRGGYYLGTYSGSTAVPYSTDGISWSVGTLPFATGGGLSSAKTSYNGSAWVTLLGGNTNTTRIARATGTPATFSAQTSSNNSYPAQTIAYNGTIFCVANGGAAGTTVETSPDGITWTSRTTPSYTTGNVVALGNLFILVDSISTATSYYTSTDGVTWTTRSLPVTAAYPVICGSSVVLYNNVGKAAISSDGINWTTYTMSMPGISGTVSSIESGPSGKYMVAGGASHSLGSTTIYCSYITTDYGVTWEKITPAYANVAQYPSTDGLNLFLLPSISTPMVYTANNSRIRLPYAPGNIIKVRS